MQRNDGGKAPEMPKKAPCQRQKKRMSSQKKWPRAVSARTRWLRRLMAAWEGVGGASGAAVPRRRRSAALPSGAARPERPGQKAGNNMRHTNAGVVLAGHTRSAAAAGAAAAAVWCMSGARAGRGHLERSTPRARAQGPLRPLFFSRAFARGRARPQRASAPFPSCQICTGSQVAQVAAAARGRCSLAAGEWREDGTVVVNSVIHPEPSW